MSPLAFAVFAILLVWAAVGDVRAYRIPNWLCVAVAVAGLVLAFPGSTDVWIARAESVGAVAAIGLVLYLAHALGGGDYKLLVAVAFWMPVGELAPFAVLLAIAGGVQAIATLLWRRFAPAGPAPAARPHARAMPYGVSIAIAGILWGVVAVGMG
jgi:Flp pilus assembly protein protease CpaA